MPMQLLMRLCAGELPTTLDDDEDIEKCGTLQAENLVQAERPPVRCEGGQTRRRGFAKVREVTPSGWSAVPGRNGIAGSVTATA